MTVWQKWITGIMQHELCWDAAIVSIVQEQLLGAHPGGILAKVTKPEIQALLSRNRDSLLTHGLTLGGLKCLVIRDNLFTDTHQCSMDLRTRVYRHNGDSYAHAIAVVLVRPVCLILIGQKGIQGGTLNMMAFQSAQYIQDHFSQ